MSEGGGVVVGPELLLRLQVEDLLAREAWLLDGWDLDGWLELLTEDATYVIPSTRRQQGDLARELGFVNDDRLRIESRVARLQSRRAHREFPWSRTRRVVSNVLVEAQGPGRCAARAAFLLARYRAEQSHLFAGRYDYDLVEVDGAWKIRRKVVWLDLESLDPHGSVSVVL